MEFFKKTTNVDFMRKRVFFMSLSLAVSLICLVSLGIRGLNLGLDFTGGTQIELGFAKAVDLGQVRGALQSTGFRDAVVQYFGTSHDVLVRIAPHKGEKPSEIASRVVQVLGTASHSRVQLKRVEYIGPQVGGELFEDGGLAMLFALLGILVYVAFRFEYRFAVGAVLATLHDTTIIFGIFALFHIEFDLTVLAAILAVIGYSLNDTIVVFDRIRENFRKMRKGTPVEVMNAAINQTLSRTIMTSFATLLVVLALFFFGGPVIHGFSLVLIIGIVVGTYSSIYVASPLALLLGVSKADLMVAKKSAEVDDRP